MANIKIENVYKDYGDIRALHPFTLDIADGEFVVLVGPSGCGKSTMLKIVAGLEPSSGGRIILGGQDVTDLAPKNRDVAMVFQNYALYPHLTVGQNIGFGLKMQRKSKSEINQRVAEAADILGVGHLLKRKPRELSGGQRQRVALGRAIVREPQAFLMDEPLSNLDAKLRVHMRTEISALHNRIGVTTIYVTHDQIEAMTMADRVVLMNDGKIQQIDDPDSLFSHPVNLFAAGFIGSPGMNLVPAPLNVVDGKPHIEIFNTLAPVDENRLVGVEKVIAGIRPEHIHLGEGQITFKVKPTLVESLGSEKYIYFHSDNIQGVESNSLKEEDNKGFVARVPFSGQLNSEIEQTLSFNLCDLHLFDAESEEAL